MGYTEVEKSFQRMVLPRSLNPSEGKDGPLTPKSPDSLFSQGGRAWEALRGMHGTEISEVCGPG
jgi:hypothetical protein